MTSMQAPAAPAVIAWEEGGQAQQAAWRSENAAPAPKRVMPADDAMPADRAYKLACEGCALLWRGDFQNARQLLQALARRIDRPPKKPRAKAESADPAMAFHRHRQAQAQRARILGMLLIPVEADYRIALRRAPEMREAFEQAYGPPQGRFVVSLRELQGLIGAYEWRKQGVQIPALAARIHPWYGVFSPVRGEYVELVAKAPLPSERLAFDIGTGTGVLAAVLAQRGVRQVVATDFDPCALACAQDNLDRLGVLPQVQLLQADLFPPGHAPLVICNPPWLPARPSSAVEHAVYDPDSRMLKGFLQGLAAHLEPQGEGWLILSDLAEHLGLRSRAQLLEMFAGAGLQVLDKLDTKPVHRKSSDPSDPLYAARSAETTSLWRLAAVPHSPSKEPPCSTSQPAP